MRAAVVTCHLQHSGKCQCSTRHAENVSLGEVRAPAAISRDDKGELDFKGKCGAPQEHDGDDVEVEGYPAGGGRGGWAIALRLLSAVWVLRQRVT